jgi:putative heme-binding domain-containing protein
LVVSTFSQASMWANPTARKDILLLIRRFAAEGNAAGYTACLELLRSAPSQYADATHEYLRKGLAERAVGLLGIGQGALFGEQAADAAAEPAAEARHYELVNAPLKEFIADIWREKPDDASRLEIALRGGVEGTYPALKRAALHPYAKPEQRAQLFTLLREFGEPDVVPALLGLIKLKQPDAVKLSAIDVLAVNENPSVTAELIAAYPSASKELRHRIRDMLFSRSKSALSFLQSVDSGKTSKADEIPVDELRRLSLHKNPQIDDLVRKHWGSIAPGTTEEKLATMRRFNNDLRAGQGNIAAGKLLFEKHCGVCHQLYGQGNKIGPDLTTANRGDRAALLANVVDPSAIIRREFMNYVISTTSGRVLTGVIAEQDGASVTILDANNQRTKIPRNEIDELREAEVSLMPERLLDKLTPQELRDLFTYLQSPTPQ